MSDQTTESRPASAGQPEHTCLACADTPEVEHARADYIAFRMTRRMSFQSCLEVFEGALAIGRQADLFPPDKVRARMGAVQAGSTTPMSVPDTPFLSKIKGWFGTK